MRQSIIVCDRCGLRDLSGKKVLMTGFMLPLDEVQNIKEFLLVQSLWSCCYGTPPDINKLPRLEYPRPSGRKRWLLRAMSCVG